MTKVVINTRYGGFGLSAQAFNMLSARKNALDEWNLYDLPRTDPDLVAVIEALGTKEAGGNYADLEIVEIPAGTRYRIREYDGTEWIETADSIDWLVA